MLIAKVKNAQATKATVFKDGKTWTFNIRKNAKWPNGQTLIANKINGIYAAVCQDPFCAKLARQHTDSNVLCLGAKIIGDMMASEIVKTWLTTDPLMEEKYRRRVDKVKAINDKHCVPVK